MDTFRFGDILIRWECGDYRMGSGGYIERFREDDGATGEEILIRGAVGPLDAYETLPKTESAYLYDSYDTGTEPVRLYNWSYLRHGYAVFPDRLAAGDPNAVVFDPKMRRQIPLHFDWLLGICGLHKALLCRDRPILHAACVGWQGSAVLFTAPSGTGKSTQAALWQTHRGAEIINGDRILLGKRDGRWYAHGYPCCGSSDICLNRSLPLRAVVVLAQGQENRVEALTAGEKIRMLSAGMVLTPGDMDQIDMAFRLAAEIAGQVPVLRLVCRPDGEAVDVLENDLEETRICGR